MKAKRLELKEDGITPDGLKAFYLYINGKKAVNKGFEYNSETRLIEGEYVLTKKDSDKILSFSFLDLPDKSLIGGFHDNHNNTKIYTLDSLTRKGKKLRSRYWLSIDLNNKDMIWNCEIYLEELAKILAKKGIVFEKGYDAIERGDDTVYTRVDYTHKNTKGKLSELVDECIKLIKQAEQETSIILLTRALFKLGATKVEINVTPAK